MTKNYVIFDTPVKPHVGSPITLVLRGQGKPVILMGTTFAELMDALRPLCSDGKIFRLPQRLAEAMREEGEKDMRAAV